MDRDLAIAVFQRWSVGEPVSEVSLVKAASALGANPYDALLEARYYTDLTNYLNRGGGEMNDYEKHIFSGATGFHSEDMCKTASAYMLPDEELILAHLAEQNFVPYLPKLAEAMAQAGTDPNAQQGEQVQQDPELEAQMQELMAQQQMAQQQQVQAGMVKPTPTAPSQIPPSPSGNSEQLLYNEVNKDQLEQQRQQQMQQQQMQQTQQNPQQGSKEQLQQMYSAMTPEQKIQHAAPQVGQEHRQRYADTLGQVEEAAGLKITDPSQVQKVVKGVEKQDKKIIDEAIKQVTDVQAGAGGAGGGGNFGPLPGEPGDTSGQGAPGGPSPGGAAGGVDPTAGGAPPEGGPPGPQEAMPPGQGKPPQKPKTPPGGGGAPSPSMDKMAYLNELRARSFLKLGASASFLTPEAQTLKANLSNQIMAQQYAGMPQLMETPYTAPSAATQPSPMYTSKGTYGLDHGNQFIGPSGHGIAYDTTQVGPQGGFAAKAKSIMNHAPKATPVAPVAEVVAPAAAHSASESAAKSVAKKSMSRGKMLGIGGAAAAGLLGAGYAYKKHKEKKASDVLNELRARTLLNSMEKTAFLGPLVDIGNLGIPSAVGYVMGREEGRRMKQSGQKMDDPSLAAQLLVPGSIGYRYGKTTAYEDTPKSKRGR